VTTGFRATGADEMGTIRLGGRHGRIGQTACVDGVSRGCDRYCPCCHASRRIDLDNGAGYRVGMASPAGSLPDPAPVAPPPDPQAIRACLSPVLAAEFDSEWEIVLERAKRSQELAGVHDLLAKWRHTAYLEMRDPGSYSRMLAKAEQITRTGHNPDAVPFEGMQSLLQRRLGR
jgi:Family of unknown function (DUF6247)